MWIFVIVVAVAAGAYYLSVRSYDKAMAESRAFVDGLRKNPQFLDVNTFERVLSDNNLKFSAEAISENHVECYIDVPIGYYAIWDRKQLRLLARFENGKLTWLDERWYWVNRIFVTDEF